MLRRSETVGAALPSRPSPAFPVLGAISFAHLLNDLIQSLILAIYPLLKQGFDLDFGQVGLITLTYQLTASLLQPAIGLVTDRRPQPYSLPVGMGFTLGGLLLLSTATTFPALLVAAALVGSGSAVFHPESSRVARMASGGRHGLAQSLFQVGGSAGSALGPLLAAWIVVPHGRASVAGFAPVALLAIVVLVRIGRWYRSRMPGPAPSRASGGAGVRAPSRRKVAGVLLLLGALVFSKYFYLASLTSYFTFYLIERFHVSVQQAQLHLFAFLFAVAAGSLAGGPVGDRIGRRRVIQVSILGVAPFALLLPWVGLAMTGVLVVLIGLVLASAFSAILVYAHELLPGRIGTVSGLFFGLAFGLGGIGAAVLGQLADRHGIEFVYRLCAFLPLLGVLALWLPDGDRR